MTFPPKMAAFRNSLEANHSPSQLTPYDHLNMAITVTLMQVTVPPAVALILRYHTETGRLGNKKPGKMNKFRMSFLGVQDGTSAKSKLMHTVDAFRHFGAPISGSGG